MVRKYTGSGQKEQKEYNEKSKKMTHDDVTRKIMIKN